MTLTTRPARLGAAALAAAVIAGPAIVLVPAAVAVSPHASCADVKATTPGAPDAEYQITVHGKTLDVWCADMATSPSEYLSFDNVGAGFNFSQTHNPGMVEARFTRVALNLPADATSPFTIDPTDGRFRTGADLPYGFAGSCWFASNDANVDLRGTPFAVTTADFPTWGWLGHGDIWSSSNGQVITIDNGRGDCGGFHASEPLPLIWIAEAPVVTDPTDVTVTAGDDAVFTASATGDPALTVEWETSTDGTTWDTIAGATADTLTLANVAYADDGLQVRALYTNDQGTVTSGPATLTVEPLAPGITGPADVTVTSGDDATFTVTVTGDPTPTVQWQSSTDDVVWTDVTGATGTDLVLAGVTLADDGLLVRAVVTNVGGTVNSETALLTVEPLAPGVTGPADVTVTSGDDATFTVTVTGDPTPTVQWQTSADDILWTDVDGATGTDLVLAGVTAADDGLLVRAVVTNVGGTVNSETALLTVEPLAPGMTGPDDVTVNSGEDATFSVTVSGDPTPTIQWQTSTDEINWSDVDGETETDLVLVGVTTDDDGLHVRALATNGGGVDVSRTAHLTVEASVPVIVSAPTAVTADLGDDATFTVAVSGDPAPSIQWQTSTSNTGSLASLATGASWADLAGETGTSLTLNNVTASQNGLWVRAFVENDGGAVASNGVQLTVVSPAAAPVKTVPAVRAAALPATGSPVSAQLALAWVFLMAGSGAVVVASRRRPTL